MEINHRDTDDARLVLQRSSQGDGRAGGLGDPDCVIWALQQDAEEYATTQLGVLGGDDGQR